MTTKFHKLSDSSWRLLLAVFMALPSLAAANPIGFDPVNALLPLFLEAIFFAIALQGLGFKGLPVLFGWFMVTSVTWLSFIGAPLGTYAAMMAGNAIFAEEGGYLFLTGAVVIELAISLVEALIILVALRFTFLRKADMAAVKPGFAIIFQIALLGNLVSVAAGLTEMLEYSFAWLLYFAIVPLLLLARYLTKRAMRKLQAGASASEA